MGQRGKIKTKLVFVCNYNSSDICIFQGKSKARRVKTIYDCQADNDDELTFVEGEVIIVTGEEDQEWWVSSAPLLLLKTQKNTECHIFLSLTLSLFPFHFQIGHIEGDPERKGVFPMSFVHILSD